MGVVFFFAGIAKFPNVGAFVQHGIVEPFAKTWLPKWLLLPYGHALPFIEVGLGLLLFLGIARNAVLFFGGLLCISLTFGQMLLMQPQSFNTLAYAFAFVGLLVLAPYDRWVLPIGNQLPPSQEAPVPPS
jgi:thiosulfate dehydrogenase [quinone] large subunit